MSARIGTNSYRVGTSLNPSTGGVTIADLSTWDSKPSGTTDGDYGLGPNGRVWRWKAAISQWVPAGLFGFAFTQAGATLGAESVPTGWTRNLGTNATSSSNGTVYTIDTTGNVSLQDRIAITSSPAAGSFIYASGYFHVTGLTSAGSGVGATASIFHDDGSKRRLIGPSTTGAAMRFNNVGGTGQVGATNSQTQGSRAWLEYFAAGSSNSQVSLDHASVPDMLVEYSQNSNVSGTAFQIGDSSTTIGAASHYEDFRVYVLT